MAGRADTADINDFISAHDVGNFDHVVDDANGSFWFEFGIRTQPAFVFIDDDGTITSHSGRLGLEELTTEVKNLRAT